jgi:NAD(P)-dependent dehydrogenase (short-subunit alcohol dehydrogenase family)
MELAMTGWLAGKTVLMVGDSPAIAAALEAQGGARVQEGASDILVHIARPAMAKPAHELSLAQWRDVIDANLDQRFAQAQAFAASLRTAGQPGSVVFVGAPEQGFGADQAAAAGALANLTKTLGVEWARDGVRINTILTNADNETLGNLVAYLASDYAAYVTGAVMGVGEGE